MADSTPPSSIPIANPAQSTSNQFPVNITNSPSMPRSPQLPDSAQATMINQMDPQLAARRQAQMRAMQQQGARQMSPQAQGMSGMNPSANALPGSSNSAAVNANPNAANSGQPTPQQMYQMWTTWTGMAIFSAKNSQHLCLLFCTMSSTEKSA